MFAETVAVGCIAWYLFIACVCAIGHVHLFLYYRRVPRRAAALAKDKKDIPHVTVIRPCKGLEPYLYECLASTLCQDYPVDRLTVYFCVSSRSDPALETIERVVRDYGDRDTRIFVEEEDAATAALEDHIASLGPNPKIRNMSRAYREAKGDLIWIADCNVWVARGCCGHMVDRLCGFTHSGPSNAPFKLVHHLPISVDVDTYTARQRTNTSSYDDATRPSLNSQVPTPRTSMPLVQSLNRYGGRLEEMFLSSSHAKMYVGINMVAVAPCIVGKSNMFRRSHLNRLTAERAAQDGSDPRAPNGLDYFSHNICEDHLIGDLLWKSPPPALPGLPAAMRNHGLVLGDLAIQPVAGMTVSNYIARRVRWLRVRKFTVPAATLVEPGTESFLCSAYGAFGVTSCAATSHLFGNSWWWFCCWWCVSVIFWVTVDWTVYGLLHSGRTIETSDHDVGPMAGSASPNSGGNARRSFRSWLSAWLGRESLAFPIWVWAIWGGASVTWRDRRFWVGIDMKVHEINDEEMLPRRKNKGDGLGDLPNGHVHGVGHPNGALHDKLRTD